MKKGLGVLVLASMLCWGAGSGVVFGYTEVTTNITTHTTWTLAGSPYWIKGDITVASGITLTIETGVVVKFQKVTGSNVQKRKLIIDGTLDLPASGAPVIFTSDQDDDADGVDLGGNGYTQGAAGDWGYLKFNTVGNTLENAVLRYGGVGRIASGYFYDLYQVWVNAATTVIENITISDCYSKAIYYQAANSVTAPQINGSTISGCTYGIQIEASTSFQTSPTINDNSINASELGIYVNGSATVRPVATIQNNVVTSPALSGIGIQLVNPAPGSLVSGNNVHNVLQGLVINNGSPTVTNNEFTTNGEFPLTQINTSFPTYSGNTIVGNYKQAIRVNGTIAADGTWPIVQGLGLSYHVEDGNVTVAAGATLTINAGVVVKFEYLSGSNITKRSLHVDGTLLLPSTGSRVIFTSDRDDTVGGDSNGDGNGTTAAPGNWGYLKYNSPNLVQNAELRYGGVGRISSGYYYDLYNIMVNNAEVTIDNCIVKNAYQQSIYYAAPMTATSNPAITNNLITTSPRGIHVIVSNNYVTSPTVSGNSISTSDLGLYIQGSATSPPVCSINGNSITSPAGTGTGISLLYPASSSVITNNVIDYVLQGLVIEDGSPAITNNQFRNCSEFPLTQIDNSFPTYSGNVIADNYKQAIRVYGSLSSSGTWPNVQALGLPYHVEDGAITITSGATLAIDPGVVVKMETITGSNVTKRSFIVDGMLNALGEAGAEVYVTSDRDDTLGGDSNGDGTATAPAAGNWGYIKINNASNSLHHLILRYGGLGRTASGYNYDKYMVWVNQQTIDIEACTFTNAFESAVYFAATTTMATTATITNNSFYNSPVGLNFLGASAHNTTAVISYNSFQCGPTARGIQLTQIAADSAITYNSIKNNNYGIYVTGTTGAFTIDANNITGNATYGVWNSQVPCVIVTNNWWGAANGPLDNETGAGACDGTNAGNGDRISEFVWALNWATAPIPLGALDCGSAIQLTCGQTLTEQSNSGGQSNVDEYACNQAWAEVGNEIVYYVDTQSTGTLQVHLTPLSGTNPDVFILGSCDAEDCLGYGDYDAILQNAPAGRYYIVVDSPSTAAAYYNIAVYCGLPTFTPSATPTLSPTATPTITATPTRTPTRTPTSYPTVEPTIQPTPWTDDLLWVVDAETCTHTEVACVVNLSNPQTAIDAFVFDLQFDAACLDYVSCEPGALDPSWVMFQCDLVEPGLLRVAGFTYAAEIPIGSEGSLAIITFNCMGTSGFVSNLVLTNLADDLAGFYPVPGEVGCYSRNGDVNRDGRITAEDAQLAFCAAIGACVLTPSQHCAADCNGDDIISAGDAQGIFSGIWVHQCIDPLPEKVIAVTFKCAEQKALLASAGADLSSGWVWLEQPLNADDSALKVTVMIENAADPVDAFVVELRYDPAQYQFSGETEVGTLNPGWEMFKCAQVSPGVLRLAGFCVEDGIPSNSVGSLAELTFYRRTQLSAGCESATAELSVSISDLQDDLSGFEVSFS